MKYAKMRAPVSLPLPPPTLLIPFLKPFLLLAFCFHPFSVSIGDHSSTPSVTVTVALF